MKYLTIGIVDLFGWHTRLGWLMIMALIYSAISPVILGCRRQGLAWQLHAKTLFADANMNKAAWTTAVTAIVGILVVGIGWWWADSVTAVLIALIC